MACEIFVTLSNAVCDTSGNLAYFNSIVFIPVSSVGQ